MAKNLPEDYAIDALALEAERRSKELGYPYSYGQLVAATTPQQREEIAERYRIGKRKGQIRTRETFRD